MVDPTLMDLVEAVLQGNQKPLTSAEVYAHCDHVDGRATAAVVLNELCRAGRVVREPDEDGVHRFRPRKRRKAAAAPRVAPAAPLRKPKRPHRRRDPLVGQDAPPSTKPTLAERIRLALATSKHRLSIPHLADRLQAPEENIRNILDFFEVPAGRVQMSRPNPRAVAFYYIEKARKRRAA